MSDTQRHSQQVRDTANRLMERLQSDQDFAKKIKADPVGALTGEGLPQEAVGDFMHTANVPTEGEVSGYMMCSETCLDGQSARCK
ncbi:MAG: hypothetical protein QOG89_2746, partial [Thermomicrobiales bacterium]|nr:hypothetical protein [Thermomicrobiales bacterium]